MASYKKTKVIDVTWKFQLTDLGRANLIQEYEINGGILLTGQIVRLSFSFVISVNISTSVTYAIALT